MERDTGPSLPVRGSDSLTVDFGAREMITLRLNLHSQEAYPPFRIDTDQVEDEPKKNERTAKSN